VGAIPLEPCAFCKFCAWWGHHFEEWVRRKKLFQIVEFGLDYEDGGRAMHFAWSEITGVVLHRRNTIPIWRTNGSFGFASPPFWLAIIIKQGTTEQTICVWPRQVVGGLPALYRFATALQTALVRAAERGETPLRTPRDLGSKLTPRLLSPASPP
jgi:hypothetical protein